MNCAEFEHGLTDLLAGELSPDERRALAARLKEHADRCKACGAGDDLLDWSSLEPSDRFGDEDPGPEYWADFEKRLADRIRRERPGRSRTAWLVAAAAVLVAVSALWFFRPTTEEPVPGPATVAGTTTDAEEFRLPEPIEDRLRDPSVDAVPFDGLLTPAGYEAVLEDSLQLDDRERSEFLEWLRDQSTESKGDKA